MLPIWTTLYPQFNLSGPQITLHNQTGRWGGDGGWQRAPEGPGLGEGHWLGALMRPGSMPGPFPPMPACCGLQPSPWLQVVCSTPSPNLAPLPSSLPGSFFPPNEYKNPVLVLGPMFPLPSPAQPLAPLRNPRASCRRCPPWAGGSTSRPMRGMRGGSRSFTHSANAEHPCREDGRPD